MKKSLLLVILLISFLIEAVLTFLCFFNPTKAFELFGLAYSEQTSFLGYIIAWFCLLVTVIIGYCILQVKNDNKYSGTLIYLLAFWWIGLGIGVFMRFGKIDNLLLDSLKGFLLVIANYSYQKK